MARELPRVVGRTGVKGVKVFTPTKPQASQGGPLAPSPGFSSDPSPRTQGFFKITIKGPLGSGWVLSSFPSRPTLKTLER